ncbi:restriction endonuclease subunit S [Prevotella nigrescens]|uniref:Restriction endonuclease n=1 Tax=Prevotella intermedia TaxID=28131 RepID=A0A2M8TPG4_PREIN|nr:MULTISPECIES: restriction endonuclease subunit S [Prevotella]PJI25821.1 restriction endonuclease [Prevotella intermedia]QUB49381.1 restriction endonuclease subunit S [Prevotella nigrescens]
MHHYEQDVPNGWCKTALSEIITLLSGRDLQPTQYNSFEKGIPYITGASNIDNNTIIINRWTTAPITISHKGDLLITCKGTIGKLAFNSVGDLHIARQFMSLQFIEPLVSKYLFYCLEERISAIKQMDNGLIPGIDRSIILNQIIQLPPLAEQYRIVAEIERWFALIDTIEKSKEGLETAIKQTKSKILDLAIHGKLVPQDPKDEPASEQLRRINPKAQITCDNGHSRKLPQSWTWVKGKNIFAPMKSTKPTNEKFQYIDIDSIDNKRQIISEVKTIKTVNAPSRANRYTQKNDVVFSMVRPYLRNIAKVTNDNCIASTGFYVCSSIPQILHPDYCYYLMISDNVVNGLNQFMKGDNSPSINKGHIDEWLFPLPPLAEQQRIVQKIEKMFFILDDIQNALEV